MDFVQIVYATDVILKVIAYC